MVRGRLRREKAAALIIALVVIVLSSAYLGLIYRAVHLALVNSKMKFYAAQAQELAEAAAAVALAKINKNPAYQGEEISLGEGKINISIESHPDKKRIKIILCSAVFPERTKMRRKASYRLILQEAPGGPETFGPRVKNLRWKVLSSSFK